MNEPASPARVEHDPFAGAALARVVPSTEPQREIWLACRLGPEASLAYNEAVRLDLRGVLDADALRVALEALVARHEALRGTFGPDGTEFLIAESAELPWRDDDLRGLAADARDEALAMAMRDAVTTPFDLARGPLFRARLLRLAVDRHVLVLASHHGVCDGWSWSVLVGELAALYRADGSSDLGAADRFGDYALAEASTEADFGREADTAYWLSRLAAAPPPPELPADHARPRCRSFASARIDHVLDAGLVAAIRATGASRKASFFATLLAAFATLLHRLGGQDNLVIGVPSAGQAGGEHPQLVGHCVHVLPVRVAIDPSRSFGELLDGVRREVVAAFEHRHATLGGLLRHLALPRDPSRLPLTGVLFNLDQALDESAIEWPGISFDVTSVARTHEIFELFVNAVQDRGTLRLECQYNSDLFDAQSVARWLAAYETLLRGAVADSGTACGRLPLASPAALAELAALQPEPVPRERGVRVEQVFFAQAARTPERIAVAYGDVAVSYADLGARVRAIASALVARGIGAGARVGIALDRSPNLPAAMLGVLATGAAYVPIDPAFPADRIRFMIDDAHLDGLVSESRLASGLPFPAARTVLLDAGPLTAAIDLPPPGGDDAIAYVIYTSGSTGTPKGVCVPHRGIVNFLASMARQPGLRSDDRLLAVTTLSFDIAVLELLLPLSVGAAVVLASRTDAGDGHALAALVERHDVTIMQGTPSSWRLLLDAGWPGRAGFKALCGGETLPPDLARRLVGHCTEVWNLYGPTETTIWSTCARVTDGADVTIGRPIDNTTVWILDEANGPLPVGMSGEIAIGGAGVAAGYLDRPELTGARFITDPFASTPGARLYRTGDRGRWRNDGRLEHFGRLNFQVKLRGHRIELGEIEANLATHPAIDRALAVVREDRPGDQRLVAYVTTRTDGVGPAELRTHLRKALPESMLPQHFVVLDAIPLLPNGKIDRNALPAPNGPAGPTRAASRAPTGATERRVAAMMEDVLALPGLGADDDFFALGGHSLLAAQLTTRLNREFGVALSLRALFDTPTIAGLAATIEGEGQSAKPPSIPRLPDRERAPLSPAQARLWAFEQLYPGTVVYNTPSAHRLAGPLDEMAFQRAFDALVERQSVLRTTIRIDDREPEQHVVPPFTTPLFPAEDLSAVPADRRDAVLMERLATLADQPFDFAVAPLFRAHLFRLAPGDHVLFFMAHHVIWDGWSFDLFYAEFAELYAAIRAGRTPSLPSLPVTYGDFAAWQRDQASTMEYRRRVLELAEDWRQRLGVRGAPHPLPTDRPRQPGAVAATNGGIVWFAVPKAEADALRALAGDAGCTPFVVLLAAFSVLLHRIVRDGQIIIATPARIRTTVEVEQVMGLFTQLLPIPLDIDPAQSFTDLVRTARRVVLDAFADPAIQLDDILREPGLREAAGGPTLHQAQFSYQDARARNSDWGGLEQRQVPIFQSGAAEDLSLWLLEHPEGMIGGAIHDTTTLDTATVERWVAEFRTLLERVVADPMQTIASLARDFDAGSIEPPQAGTIPTRAIVAHATGATAAGPTTRPTGQPDARPSPSTPIEPDAGTIADPATEMQSPAERLLAGIWIDLLGVPDVRPDDNFFDLGGHSLLAAAMLARVEKLTRIRLNLLKVANGTLRALASELPADGTAAPSGGVGARLRRLFGRDAQKDPA